MAIKSKPERISMSLLDAFDAVRVKRVKNGLDTKTMLSNARISEAMAKDPRTHMILDDISRRPRKKK